MQDESGGPSNVGRREENRNLSRRHLLTALGSITAATSLAGCTQKNKHYEFEASPVHLGEEGMRLMGYSSGDHQPIKNKRTKTIGGTDVGVSVTSHLVTYSPTTDLDEESLREVSDATGHGLTLGLLSTPHASVLGQRLNPLATLPLGRLLTERRVLDALRNSLGGTDSGFEWIVEPEPYGEPQETAILGQHAPVQAFVGLLEHAGGREAVTAYLGRVNHGESAVLVAGIKRMAVAADAESPIVSKQPDDSHSQSAAESRAARNIEEAADGVGAGYTDLGIVGRQYETLVNSLENIEIGPPVLKLAVPPVTPGKLRIVQTVEDTVVTNTKIAPVSPGYIIVDDPAAAVFKPEIGGTGSLFDRLERYPEEIVFEVKLTEGTRHRRYSGQLDIDDLKNFVMSGDDHRAVWTQLTQETLRSGKGPNDDLPVFNARENLQEITVTFYTPSHRPLGSGTIRESQDFHLAVVPPLRVGFIMAQDQTKGDNYGTWGLGWAAKYTPHVENCLQYLDATYPGAVIGYREEENLVMGSLRKITRKIGPFTVKFPGVIYDHRLAKKYLSKRAGQPGFPKGGTLYTHGISNARAMSELKRKGFDVIVMVTPGADPNNTKALPSPGSVYGSYYDYHEKTTKGRRKLGVMYHDHRLAVSGLDYGDPWLSALDAASTAAHELSHYFVDAAYQSPPAHPYAQRDDDGTDTRYQGAPIDVDHARHRNSSLTSSGTDVPGVESVGFDLRNGRFRVVNRPTFEKSSGRLVQKPLYGQLRKYESFMSYSDPAWTDAVVYQKLTEGNYNWTCGWGKEVCVVTPPSNSKSKQGHSDSGKHEQPTRERLLTAIGKTTENGAVTVADYEILDGFREPTEDGDDVHIELLSGLDGESLTSETHPASFGGHHVDREHEIVFIELPFEPGTTHLRSEYDGAPLTSNVISGVIESSLNRLPTDTVTDGANRQFQDELEALERAVDEDAIGQAMEILQSIRDLVTETIPEAEPTQDAGPHGVVGFANVASRADVLEQLDMLSQHLKAMG